jgi:hypothetical protein
VHFTSDNEVNTAYDVQMSILYEGAVRTVNALARGTAHARGNSQECACLSEILLIAMP